MNTIIVNCIESGCYSVVFAILLVYLLRSNGRREKCYSQVISELCVQLREIGELGIKTDKLLEICTALEKIHDKRGKRVKEELCGLETLETLAAEG